MSRPQPSRRRYRAFVQDYKQRRLDDGTEPGEESPASASPMPCRPANAASTCASTCAGSGRTASRSAGVFVLALLVAGLEMVEPLFMRFIIDRVLLNTDARHGRAPVAAAPGRRACSSA